MLSIALPKGRLGDKVYQLFRDHGYPCAAMEAEDDRRLVLRDEASGVQYLLVKPSDVAIYVEHGAADVGVVGKDVLLEGGNDVYELLDLGFGRCNMCVAAPVGFREDLSAPLRVATKYPAIAKRYYAGKSREIEIIKLNGSIELAPILGLSDVIVDIVETGATLRQNHLEVTETILPISARLIANKAAMRFQAAAIQPLLAALQTQTSEGAKA
ncbi:MAG: ATP phosphoribosyltransferase [Candidatus Limiplasma sp.]|nr:ATP phosphoribosyltransferase [Candidatus Limiplasma sp.]